MTLGVLGYYVFHRTKAADEAARAAAERAAAIIEADNERRLKDDPYLLRDLMSFIDENHIPVKKEQISFQRPEPKEVIISAAYTVHCKFYWLEKTYKFTPSTQNEPVHGIIPDFAAY